MEWVYDYDARLATCGGITYPMIEKSCESVQEEINFRMDPQMYPAHTYILQIRTASFYHGRGYVSYFGQHDVLENHIASFFQLGRHRKLSFATNLKSYLWDIITFIMFIKRKNIPHKKISLTLNTIHLSAGHVKIGEVIDSGNDNWEHTYEEDFQSLIEEIIETYRQIYPRAIFHPQIENFLLTASSSTLRLNANQYTRFHAHPVIWHVDEIESFIFLFADYLSGLSNQLPTAVDEQFNLENKYDQWLSKMDNQILQSHINPLNNFQINYSEDFKGFVTCCRNIYAHRKDYQQLFRNRNGVHAYLDYRWPTYIVDI